jgi:integrase
MEHLKHNPGGAAAVGAIVVREAGSGKPFLEFERMASRRFQNPEPKREGKWWYIRPWQDVTENSVLVRKRQRIKVAPATMKLREVKKIASEMLRPMNQGLITIGSAVNFKTYVDYTYKETVLPTLASTTRGSYEGMIAKYLEPTFGSMCLRDLSPRTLQLYFSGMANDGIAHATALKVRDALSSILRSAVQYDCLVKNPLDGLTLPPDRKARRSKPFITPAQLADLLEAMPEPYASMVYVAVWTGLRVSEVIGLRWRCIHADAITIEERGDWAAPKTNASAATIGVDPEVIERIQRLKILTVDVKAGRGATRKHKVVKSDGPDDLVFQSVWKGLPMRDGNILRRFIKPAARACGLSFVNWRCLRTSHATWLVQAGADAKSVQAQMRHTRISTTMDIYAQIVPEAQRHALRKLAIFAKESVPNSVPLLVQ